jgi:integrase
VRESELLVMRTAQVDFGRGLIFVTNPKWRKDPRRTEGLPVCDEALKILAELCARSDRLFTKDDGSPVPLSTASGLFRLRALKAGLKGMRFHFLRHTFGSRLAEAGASPYEIARLMGHASISTSMIYVHPSNLSLRTVVENAAARRVGHHVDTRKWQRVG